MLPALFALSTRSLVVIFGSTFVSSDSSSLSSESGSAGSSPSLASVEKNRFYWIYSLRCSVYNWKEYIMVYHYLL